MLVTYLLIAAVGVTLLPILLDVLGTFVPVGRVGNALVSYVLVALLYGLSGSAMVIFSLFFVPYYRAVPAIPWWTEPLMWVVAVWAWVNINYTYTVTILWRPQTPPPAPSKDEAASDTKEASNNDAVHANNSSPSTNDTDTSRSRWCRYCSRHKPQYTHHCRICGTCVAFMDHHCPLTATCISTAPDGNMDMFVLFLAWISVAVGFTAIVCAHPFLVCLKLVPEWPLPNPAPHLRACSELGQLVLLFLPAAIAMAPLSALLLFHVYLGSTRQTTLQLLGRINQWVRGALSLRDLIGGPAIGARPTAIVFLKAKPAHILFPMLAQRRINKAE